MPTLCQIITADALTMTGVCVDVNSSMGTVCISDLAGEHDDIFMQGDDADKFINERNALYDETGVLNHDAIELHLARSYCETLWN